MADSHLCSYHRLRPHQILRRRCLRYRFSWYGTDTDWEFAEYDHSCQTHTDLDRNFAEFLNGEVSDTICAAASAGCAGWLCWAAVVVEVLLTTLRLARFSLCRAYERGALKADIRLVTAFGRGAAVSHYRYCEAMRRIAEFSAVPVPMPVHEPVEESHDEPAHESMELSAPVMLGSSLLNHVLAATHSLTSHFLQVEMMSGLSVPPPPFSSPHVEMLRC